jgi:methionine aminotransferase
VQNYFQSKLPEVKPSIFSVMSALAHQHNALNLSQGFPNFESDKKLIDLVAIAMNEGFNQYAPMAGVLELREAIANKFEFLYGSSYHPETEITVTAGATQAIYTIISTFIKQDDEVIIFRPAYDCYEPTVQLNGGKIISIQLAAPNYVVNWDMVKSKISDRTKMIIVNTPHNPSGSVFSKKDMLALEQLVSNTNIVLLSDEVYEHIIFDEEKHHSACCFPELKKRSFIVASFGKTFHNTGWKMGYCCAPRELMEEFQKVHQFNVFCVNRPIQHALAEYLSTPSNYTMLPSFYQQKRDLFLHEIRDARFKITPAKGTYFQVLDYSNISKEADVDMAVRLTKESKIAAIPLSVFNDEQLDNKVLRFCFAKTDDTIKRAAEILCSI